MTGTSTTIRDPARLMVELSGAMGIVGFAWKKTVPGKVKVELVLCVEEAAAGLAVCPGGLGAWLEPSCP